MQLVEERFECIPGPGGTWTVWDHAVRRPAYINGVLVGCSELQADAAKQMLSSEFGLCLQPGATDRQDDLGRLIRFPR